MTAMGGVIRALGLASGVLTVWYTGGRFFPDIQRGRYFFRDRHADSVDPADDSGLFSRASWNFSLAAYDTERNILYYYKLDT